MFTIVIDYQVKLWNTTSGFCFVTFMEHTSAVTAVTFNHTGQVVVSASGDGTVRAFDMHRYIPQCIAHIIHLVINT